MSRFVRLYPRAWRDRYESEFLGLIEERPPALAERFDIVRGAIDAHLHPQVRRRGVETRPPPVSDADLGVARRLGFATLVGAVLWPAAFAVAATGPVVYDGSGPYRDGSAAFPILILAVLLLAGGLLGHLIQLPAEARLARAGALTAIPFLLLFGMGPWMWPLGLTAIVLLIVLAIGGLRSGAWPAWASVAVVVASLGVVAIVALGIAVAGGDRLAGGVFFVVAGLVLVPVWLSVGATLVWRPALSDPART